MIYQKKIRELQMLREIFSSKKIHKNILANKCAIGIDESVLYNIGEKFRWIVHQRREDWYEQVGL